MKNYILRLKINGIKNIDKEIELNFYNNLADKNFKDFQKSHITAIYGANGAGKTGIIQAMEIYQNLFNNKDYLIVENANGHLKNVINQKTKKFTLDIVFAVFMEEVDTKTKNEKVPNTLKNIYKHYLCIEEVGGSYKLTADELYLLKGKNINQDEKFTPIYKVKDGEIVDIQENLIGENEKEELIKKTMNILHFQTLPDVLLSKDNYNFMQNKKFIFPYIVLEIFALKLIVVMQDSDNNYINFDNLAQQANCLRKYKEQMSEEEYNKLLLEDKFTNLSVEKIPKKLFTNYEDKVKKLTSFLKVFKDDLNNIEIKKYDNGDFYECELILVYKDGKKINKEYESSGIKKLITLYSALNDCVNGKIVFIDEIDANIHDVLLTKIIEFISLYSKGQFIFTTHNIEPMEVLKNNKYSIKFLSQGPRMTFWVKNGNYSPASLYKKGLIEYSPFNIEPENFLGILGDFDYE